ncbi:MAG: AAC(3) family N-acetyltransferase [Prevotella sp.]|nr:AAC(3) family N-acetyltransferase [Prevotella sp.]
MGLSGIYNRIALSSPHVEVLLRKLYWKNVKHLGKFNPHKVVKTKAPTKHVDFNQVLGWLRCNGVGEGSLLVVHSSYSALECTGLEAKQIIEELLGLVGETGTLAMPAIRKYKEEPHGADILTTNTEDLICTYNVKKTIVQSGMLPFTMLRRKDSAVSHHPFNPLVAVGPLAKPMMEHNLDGEAPSPHGPNSCWKFCYDHNAFVIGLGVGLDHYNTISHVNEEAFGNWKWSEEEWYRKRKFVVFDEEGNKQNVVVKERKPEWGMLRFAELHANKDRNESGLIKRTKIDGEIIVCLEKAREYVDYLQENNKKGKYYYL